MTASPSFLDGPRHSWLYCGSYFTRELMFKMKKIKSSMCACNKEINENVSHFILHCTLYDNIRQQYLPKLLLNNTKISEIINNENLLVIFILDPLSSKLPEDIWSFVSAVYGVARKCCHRMHLLREKIYKELDNI